MLEQYSVKGTHAPFGVMQHLLSPKKENREGNQQSLVMKSLIVKVKGNPPPPPPPPPPKKSALEERKERVEEVKSELREKHGDSYTPLQYTLWAEMVGVGTHKSLDNPPQVQMFTGKRKQKPDNEMSTVFTELAKSVVNVLSPQTRPLATNSGGVSPNKLADLRSKYIHQMRELHSLYEMGALTESEFKEQKEPILSQLKKFTPT